MFRFFLSIIHLIVLIAALIHPGNSILAQNIKSAQSFRDSLEAKIDAKVKPFVDKGFSGAVLVARNNKIILNKTSV